ncbi:MAG: O-antigen ligase family protein [Minisyncoccia bacterium]
MVKKSARWVALGALFLIPLAPLIVANFFFFPFITGKAFYFRILVEVLVCAWLVLALLDKRYRTHFSWVTVAVLAFVAWMFVADLAAVNVVKAFWSNFERMEGWVLLVHLLGFFLAASAVLRVEKKWREWFLASLAVSVIVVFHSILQIAGIAAIHQGANRIDASFGNSAYLAIYFLFNVFIALWLALTEKRQWFKWSLIALAVIEAFLIFETETRGTILGLTGGLALAALLFAIFAGGRVRRFAVSGLVVIVVLVLGFLAIKDTAFVKNNDVLNRLSTISLADGQVRFTLWHMAWEGVTAGPKQLALGYGQEGYNYVFNKYYVPSLYGQEQWFDRAHNAFIDWFVAGGVPAFLLYIALFATAFLMLWRSTASRPEKILLTAALSGYVIHNLFVFDNLYAYIYFFAILALIDSQVGVPIRRFEAAPELDVAMGGAALAGAGVLAALLIWFVNIPQMEAAGNLITAISSTAAGPSNNLAAFENLVTQDPPQMQEIREQLVSFASQVAQNQSTDASTTEALVTLAVTQMQEQITRHPGDVRTILELSAAYSAGNDLPDALTAVGQAEALSPGKEATYVQEGALRWDMGDTAGAKAAFDKAYALGPSFSDLAVYAAVGDFITGNKAGADQILVQTFGTTTVDNDTLALAYYRLKDWPDLIALWQLRAAAPSATANDAFGLAAAYYVAGDKTQAIAEVNAAIAKYPSAAAEGAQLLQEIKAAPSAPQ